MRSLFLTFIVLAGCAASPKQADVAGPQVSVLGTLHRNHLDGNFHYSLEDLDQVVRIINPDLICGEVPPSAVHGLIAGYFPPEQRIFQHIAQDLKIPFVPSDWRAPAEEYVAAKKVDEDLQKVLDSKQQAMQEEIQSAGGRSFSLLHSFGFQNRIKDIHELVIKNAGEGADGFWLTRNANIVNLCATAIQRQRARRVLFVFGVDHKYIIEENIVKMHPNFRIQSIPNIIHSPQQKLQYNLKTQWMLDRKNLELFTSDKNESNASRDQVRKSSRINDLGQFIDSQK